MGRNGILQVHMTFLEIQLPYNMDLEEQNYLGTLLTLFFTPAKDREELLTKTCH